MRKICVISAVVLLSIGCQKKHPSKVFVEPSMAKGAIEKIAVFPFASSLHHSDDPDNQAPEMMDQYFRQQLEMRNDYKFTAPTTVTYAVEREDLEDEMQMFVDDWRTSQKVKVDFLKRLSSVLNVDAVLIGVVDLWQKTEVDVADNATPMTYVGATVTIIGAEDGKILFQASDENFLEGVRSETTSRTVIRSGSGKVYNDPSANLYRAPPFENVAIRVASALAKSIPAR